MQEMMAALGNALKGELLGFLMLDSVSEKRSGFGVFCLAVIKGSSCELKCFIVSVLWHSYTLLIIA